MPCGERLQAACEAYQAPLCVTGIGSLLTIHGVKGPVRSNADLAGQDQRIKELVFFDLLERGIYIARRGMAALSFEIDENACDVFVTAFEQIARTKDIAFHGSQSLAPAGR